MLKVLRFLKLTLLISFFLLLSLKGTVISAEILPAQDIKPFSTIALYEKDGNVLMIMQMNSDSEENAEILSAYWTANGVKKNLSNFWIVREKEDRFLILLEAQKAIRQATGKLPMLCLLTASHTIPERLFCLALEEENVTLLSDGEQRVRLQIP